MAWPAPVRAIALSWLLLCAGADRASDGRSAAEGASALFVDAGAHAVMARTGRSSPSAKVWEPLQEASNQLETILGMLQNRKDKMEQTRSFEAVELKRIQERMQETSAEGSGLQAQIDRLKAGRYETMVNLEKTLQEFPQPKSSGQDSWIGGRGMELLETGAHKHTHAGHRRGRARRNRARRQRRRAEHGHGDASGRSSGNDTHEHAQDSIAESRGDQTHQHAQKHVSGRPQHAGAGIGPGQRGRRPPGLPQEGSHSPGLLQENATRGLAETSPRRELSAEGSHSSGLLQENATRGLAGTSLHHDLSEEAESQRAHLQARLAKLEDQREEDSRERRQAEVRQAENRRKLDSLGEIPGPDEGQAGKGAEEALLQKTSAKAEQIPRFYHPLRESAVAIDLHTQMIKASADRIRQKIASDKALIEKLDERLRDNELEEARVRDQIAKLRAGNAASEEELRKTMENTAQKALEDEAQADA